MGYKSENKEDRFDKNWITFPDEPEPEDSNQTDTKYDIWKDEGAEDDGRAEDLLLISKLEGVVLRLNMYVNTELTRRESANTKPLPLPLRILLHTPKNNKDVLIYHAIFGSLMILSILMFAWAMGLIL